MAGLSERMRRLIESNTEFTIPLEVGDPASSLTVGAVIDLGNDKRPTIAHLTKPPFNVDLGSKSVTGVFDVDLGLSKLLTANAELDTTVNPDTNVQVGLKLRYERDVALSLDPAKGERIDVPLLLVPVLAKHPSWKHARYAFVFRTFVVKQARMHIAKKGGGSITLTGRAKAVSNAISGVFDAGVTWDTNNVLTETIDEPGILGVHCARVLKKGSLRVV